MLPQTASHAVNESVGQTWRSFDDGNPVTCPGEQTGVPSPFLRTARLPRPKFWRGEISRRASESLRRYSITPSVPVPEGATGAPNSITRRQAAPIRQNSTP